MSPDATAFPCKSTVWPQGQRLAFLICHFLVFLPAAAPAARCGGTWVVQVCILVLSSMVRAPFWYQHRLSHHTCLSAILRFLGLQGQAHCKNLLQFLTTLE